MAQVLVPNIILTKNYDLIKNIFLNKEFLQLDEIKSNQRDVFFISGKNNKYLNSFEYSLNVDKKIEIVLRIFDFDNNFEFEYLSDGFLKNYFKGLLSNAVTLAKLNSLSKASVKNKLYFSFGVGPDLKNWADPMSADLKEAYIEIDTNGRRYYILKFVPNNDTPLFRENIFYNIGKVNPESELGFLNDVSPTLKVSVMYFQQEKPNIDLVLKDLTKKYISTIAKTSDGNCLLLFPSVFDNFEKYFMSRLKGPVSDSGEDLEYLSSIRELFGFNSVLKTFESIPENLVPSKNTTDFNNQRSDVLDEVDAKGNKSINEQAQASVPLPFIQPDLINGTRLDDPTFIPPGMMRDEVTGDLKSDPYDRDFPTINSPNQNRILDSMLNVPVKNPYDLNAPSQDLPVQGPPTPRPPSHYPAPEPKPVESKQWIFSIDISNYLASDNSIRSAALVDWYRPLNKINDGIQSLLGEKGVNREFFISTEVDILKLELLAKEKVISDANAPCIIMGDVQAIRNYYHRDGLAFDQDMSPGSTTPFGPIKTLSDYSLQQKLTSKFYLNGLSNLLSRRRSNSGFSEKIILDELNDYSINKKANSKFIDFIGNNEFFKNSDTPIFMHNLKNSNVLAITVLQNTIPYLQTVNFSVGNTTENELLLKVPANYEKSVFYYNTKINFEKLVEDVIKEYKEIMEKEAKIREIRKNNNYIDSSPTNYAFNNLLDSILSIDYTGTENYTEVGSLPIDAYQGLTRRKNNFLKFLQASNNDNDLVRKNILTLLGKNVRSLPVNSYGKSVFFDEFLANDTEIQAELSLIAEYINAVLNAGVDNSGSFIEINKNLISENSSADSLKARLFAHLYEKMSATVSVRTVPFFWVAGLRAVNKQAILLSKKVPPIAGPINPAVVDVSEIFDFFSGIFNISGIKHVINTSECYSEFVLARTGLTPDGIK